jgi:predicted kinase
VQKLIMCMGLPGSGKSYWAQKQVRSAWAYGGLEIGKVTTRRVNKDDIRTELEKTGWKWSRENEREVISRRDDLIRKAFEDGAEVVISDDTNFGKHEAQLRQIAKECGADFEIEGFTGVPLDTCIERDALREGKGRVGEKVIRGMAETYLLELLPFLAAPKRAVGGPQLYLDLDGVFADFDGFIEKEFGIKGNRENEQPDFWDIVRGYDKRCSICRKDEGSHGNRPDHRFVSGRLYFDMSPLPGAQDLWAALTPLRPIILTGCPYSIETAAQDKKEWVKKYLDPDVQVITCKSRNKYLYMRPGDVLLDDWPKYRDLIEGFGVKFIHYKGDNKDAVAQITSALED